MSIDTLILSGGSVKGLAYIGVIKKLLDNNILDFNTLKHVICASVGCIMIIPFLFKKNIHVILKIFLKSKIKMFDCNSFNIKTLFEDFGCFENTEIEKFIKTICKYFTNNENLTLKEFYDISNIKYTVKVVNVTKAITEYFNYENQPDMPLYILCKMASAVPLIFKPVLYKNSLYSDGATNTGLPIEYLKIKKIKGNYLGIMLSGGKNKKYLINGENEVIKNLFSYIYNFLYVHYYCNESMIFLRNKNIIFIFLDKPMSFEINEKEKKEFILEGYNQTDKHIKKYFNS